jgi:TIMELESS-interacting protein
MKSNHPSGHQDAEEDYFSDKGDDDDNNSNGEEKTWNDDENSKKATKIKVVIRKPQPKLDANRVCGQRGLKCLLELFEKIKPKGEGHEFSDLDMIVSKYEYWAHRLFPQMKFIDVIERLEKLGDKREIKSMLNNLRLGEGIEIPSELNPDFAVDLAMQDEIQTNRVMNMMANMRQQSDNDDDDDLMMDDDLESFLNQAEKKSQTQNAKTIQNGFPTEEEENEILNRL